jgi:hypothetical protein
MEKHLTDEQFDAAVASLRAETRAAAERPELFWQRQRADILARLDAPAAFPRPLAWVSAAALLALAVLLSLPGSSPVAVAPPPDPDRQLMLEVQQTLEREVPDALAPASLLTQEMSQALESNSKLAPHSGRRTQ